MLPKDVGMSQDGTKDFDELFNAKLFGFPKPVSLIRHFIDAAVVKDKDEPTIVLDFFSGSATTAQAVMELNNADDGYNLEFILVQWQEAFKPDSEAAKAGYNTIDQIGMERIKRAAQKIKASNSLFSGDLGFKHFTLEEAPENALLKMEKFDPTSDAFPDLSAEDFGVDTVLRTWLVRDGYGLTAEAEEIDLAGYKAFYKGNHLYFILSDHSFCADSLVALMDKYNGEAFSPQNIVIFGYSFGFTHREELQKNLRTLKDGNKSLTVNIDVRY